MGDAMTSLQGIGQIGTAITDKRKADLLAKEGALRVKESEQKIALGDKAAADKAQQDQLIADTERRGALAPAAMTGTGPGNNVDMNAVKMANQHDSDAKLYNLVNQDKEGFMPLSGGAYRKMVESRALEANQADQKALNAEAQDKKEFGLKEKDAETRRISAESGHYTPVVLGGERLGAMNTRSGQVADTGEKSPPKASDLPIDVKSEVGTLSTKNAGKISIANQLENHLAQFQAAKTDDDKVRIGNEMLKILNSTEGSDAVGTDERKNLGDALDYHMANVKSGLGMQTGKFHGRDLPGFETQAQATINAIKGAIKSNRSEVDRVMGRTQDAPPPAEPKAGDTKKNTHGDLIRFNGKIWELVDGG